MRWEDLFRDLEAQLEAAETAELATEVAELRRVETARLRLVDRFRAAEGQRVVILVRGGSTVEGRLAGVGSDWVLVDAPGGGGSGVGGAAGAALVPAAAVVSVQGLSARSTSPGSEGQVASRLGLAHALRGVARDRSEVSVALVDGSALAGTVDRVGADFVELAEHPVGEPRRRGDVRRVRTVPFAAIAVVRSR